MKRRRAKPRAKGTACAAGKRCIAIDEHNGRRYCAKHLADVLFAENVRASLDGRCWAAGTEPLCNGDLQCAHIMSRRYRALRWDRDNARPLCAGHHYWFTLRPAEWEQFCRDHGIDWNRLRFKALNHPSMQPQLVIERLRAA